MSIFKEPEQTDVLFLHFCKSPHSCMSDSIICFLILIKKLQNVKLIRCLILELNLCSQVHGGKGPIFEDGPNFDNAFKLFHGKDGVVPLSGRSYSHKDIPEAKPELQFNPLAAKAATISLSSFGPGGPLSFGSFSNKGKKQNSNSSSKKEPPSQVVYFFPAYRLY